jgi:hypothetical protein
MVINLLISKAVYKSIIILFGIHLVIDVTVNISSSCGSQSLSVVITIFAGYSDDNDSFCMMLQKYSSIIFQRMAMAKHHNHNLSVDKTSASRPSVKTK